MIRALWTSASGIAAQRSAVDAIASNVANVSTTGFKKNLTQFQDSFYQQASSIGEFEPSNLSRTGVLTGTGVKVGSTDKVFSQGRLEQTGNQLDVAIDGEGFFRVLLADGTLAYTRDGSFKADESGQLMTSEGYKLDPPITIPRGASDITIYPDGTVSVRLQDSGALSNIGRITLSKVDNPSGLLAVGGNLFMPTAASGNVTEVYPDSLGAGTLDQGFLEGSNVELADEMTQLVIAQRAFQFNSRALQTADEMLQVATNIRG